MGNLDVIVKGRLEIIKHFVVGLLGGLIISLVLLLLALPVYIGAVIWLIAMYIVVGLNYVIALVIGEESKALSGATSSLTKLALQLIGFFGGWQLQTLFYTLLLSKESPYPFGPKPKNMFAKHL